MQTYHTFGSILGSPYLLKLPFRAVRNRLQGLGYLGFSVGGTRLQGLGARVQGFWLCLIHDQEPDGFEWFPVAWTLPGRRLPGPSPGHMSYSLNSLKGDYIGDYIGNYYRAF